MLVTMKSSELIDKLITIADGDFDLVQRAVAACAKDLEGAELAEVIQYIEDHRQHVAA